MMTSDLQANQLFDAYAAIRRFKDVEPVECESERMQGYQEGLQFGLKAAMEIIEWHAELKPVTIRPLHELQQAVAEAAE